MVHFLIANSIIVLSAARKTMTKTFHLALSLKNFLRWIVISSRPLSHLYLNLILIYWLADDTWSFFFWLFSFASVSTYAYISFLKVYQQGWFKTLIKFNLVDGIYVLTLLAFFVIEAAISFLMF